jgi:single-stranded DNA-binding protein
VRFAWAEIQMSSDPPDFANVTIWGEHAKELVDRLAKGATICIEGKAKPAAWTAQDGTVKCNLEVSAWTAEPMGQRGRQAPRRPSPDDQPRRPRAMPQAMAVGTGRHTREPLGPDDDLDGWTA